LAVLTSGPAPRGSALRRALLAAAKALVIALCLLTAWIVACQSSLVYFPTRDLDASAASRSCATATAATSPIAST
jgi:hypothetical protein